jgi:hypothetical protein
MVRKAYVNGECSWTGGLRLVSEGGGVSLFSPRVWLLGGLSRSRVSPSTASGSINEPFRLRATRGISGFKCSRRMKQECKVQDWGRYACGEEVECPSFGDEERTSGWRWWWWSYSMQQQQSGPIRDPVRPQWDGDDVWSQVQFFDYGPEMAQRACQC